MLITSLENEKIKFLKKLHYKKHRDQSNYFLIEGEDIVTEALKSNYLEEVFAIEKTFSVKTTHINKKIANKLTFQKTSDYVFGLCKKKSNSKIGKKIIYLDNVQEPGNVGAIIRSAVAFGFDTAILKSCADLYNDKVIRSSKGMLFHINILEVDSHEELEKLSNSNYQIIGAENNINKTPKTIVKDENFVIIMGNEGKGISKQAKEFIKDFITIPINSKCESLNVAVAASIIMFQINK